ncbi:hypothetical protein HHK36_004859 [Tetracentron sinense]|uniref:Uncharacterized protein n=1 Tax=Tetracentron sinense TaxID=13715 RepID=A0A834ZNG6_TETSI|nr:hypothetical protein HHK36_004859 [Tetracentron sinense]
MGQSCLLTFLLVSALLALSISQGFGGEVMMTFENEVSTVLTEENSETAREMIEVMDYKIQGPTPTQRLDICYALLHKDSPD